MSIVCAAMKNGVIAISCDTQSNFGSINVTSRHIQNSNKLYSVNKSIIGIVGWHAIADMFEHLIKNEKKLFQLDTRMNIYSTLIKLHEKMKDDYFIETREDEDQPVESSQLDALIINQQGIFEISSYREVNQYKTFWGIGSGRSVALGAMHALYETKATAKQIVEAGVKAAAEFNDGCGLPLKTRTLKIKK